MNTSPTVGPTNKAFFRKITPKFAALHRDSPIYEIGAGAIQETAGLFINSCYRWPAPPPRACFISDYGVSHRQRCNEESSWYLAENLFSEISKKTEKRQNEAILVLPILFYLLLNTSSKAALKAAFKLFSMI